MPSRIGYHNPVMPLDRPAAKRAPFAYMKTQQPATKNPGTGRFAGTFPKVSGGSMQQGGKRRPNRKP